MTLKVTHIEKHDIPAAVRLHLRAFANFPLLNAIYPSAAQSSIWLDHMYHAMDTAHADSCQNLLKVSSPEDGHLMGIAEWERCSGASIDHKPSPARPLPEGGNVEVHAAHNKERSEKRATIVGDRQYHYLAILATDPTYQGRGVARELVQWGLSRAEAEGVEAYLEAGPAVLGFYIKLGFDKVATMVVAGVDPGEDGMQNEIYCMVSKPRSISCE